MHLYFLAEEPVSPDLELMDALKRESEAYLLSERVLYLHTPEGFGRSKLAAKVERALDVPVTARNWRAVMRLLAMAGLAESPRLRRE